MDKKFIEEFDRKQKSHKHKHKKGKWEKEKDSSSVSHNKQSKQTKTSTRLEKNEEASHKPSTSYRDRAQERREGLNKDFVLDPDDLFISNPIIDNSKRIEGISNVDQVNDYALEDEKQRKLQQIEESKYLGGDVEHTHLVKGLDFALLEKIKNDQKLIKDRKKDAKNIITDEIDEEEFGTNAILVPLPLGSSKRQFVDIEKLKKNHSTEMVHCHMPKTRKILDVLGEKWTDKSELFLPGRLAYILQMNDEDDYNNDHWCVKTVMRSKLESASNNEPTTGDAFINKLIEIFNQSQTDAREAKLVKSQKKTITSYQIADDIFD